MIDELIEASISGDLQTVRRLIHEGVDVNGFNSEGYQAIHIAARFGQKDVIEELLNTKRVCVNVKSRRNGKKNVQHQPLHKAVFRGQVSTIEFLVAKNANVNARNKYGRTMIDYAFDGLNNCCGKKVCGKKSDKKCQMIDKLAESNCIRDIFDEQSKHFTLNCVFFAVAEYLIKENAALPNRVRVESLSPNNFPSLRHAYERAYFLDLIVELWSNAKDSKKVTRKKREVNATLYSFENLIKSSKCGDENGVRMLIAKGVNVNDYDNNGKQAIHYAAENGKVNVIKALLENEIVDINSETSPICTKQTCGTSLHIAVLKSRFAVIEYLIQSGANVNALNAHRATPLDYAIQAAITCCGSIDTKKVKCNTAKLKRCKQLTAIFEKQKKHLNVNCVFYAVVEYFIKTNAVLLSKAFSPIKSLKDKSYFLKLLAIEELKDESILQRSQIFVYDFVEAKLREKFDKASQTSGDSEQRASVPRANVDVSLKLRSLQKYTHKLQATNSELNSLLSNKQQQLSRLRNNFQSELNSKDKIITALIKKLELRECCKDFAGSESVMQSDVIAHQFGNQTSLIVTHIDGLKSLPLKEVVFKKEDCINELLSSVEKLKSRNKSLRKTIQQELCYTRNLTANLDYADEVADHWETKCYNLESKFDDICRKKDTEIERLKKQRDILMSRSRINRAFKKRSGL